MRFLLERWGTVFFIVASFLAVGLYIKLAGPPRLTYDSIAYMEASTNISTYLYGKNADGFSYLYRPPIIPLYLHFFQDKILAAKWLNVICYVMSLWLCYVIGQQLGLKTFFLFFLSF